MTERALLVRQCTSADGRYYAIGVEAPTVRVFDSLTGKLISVVEPPPSNLLKGGNNPDKLNPTTLSSVCFGWAKRNKSSSSNGGADRLLCVAGLSDGTALVQDVVADKLLHRTAMSDIQQPLTSVAIAGDYLIGVTANRAMTIVDVNNGNAVLDAVPVIRGVTAMAAVTGSSAGSLTILCCGSQTVVYTIHVPSHAPRTKMEKVCTVGTHTATATHAWLSQDGNVAITGSSGEGVLRVYSLGANDRGDRCRRTLPCGHRIAHVAVASGVETADSEVTNIVAATTFSGATLVWRLKEIAGRITDVVPLRPSRRFVSDTNQGKFLACGVTSEGQAVICRGRYATPTFDSIDVLRRGGAAVAAVVSSSADDVATEQVPFRRSAADAAVGESDEDDVAFDTETQFISHEKRGLLDIAAPADEFAKPTVQKAKSIKDLADAVVAETNEAREGRAIAGATVPLYQALHADDTSMVIELVAMSSQNDAAVANLVRPMQLQYVLQLLNILSVRAARAGIRSGLHRWVRIILQERAAELREYEKEQRAAGADPKTLPSSFVAPLRHHYKSLTEQTDQITLLHGRYSVFQSMRPHNLTASGTKDVTFPNEFKDANAEDPESWRIIRVKRAKGRTVAADGEDEEGLWKKRSRGKSKKGRSGTTTMQADHDEPFVDDGIDLDDEGRLAELGDEDGDDEVLEEGALRGGSSDDDDYGSDEGDDEEDFSDLDDDDLENIDLDADDSDDEDDDDDEDFDDEGAPEASGDDVDDDELYDDADEDGDLDEEGEGEGSDDEGYLDDRAGNKAFSRRADRPDAKSRRRNAD